MCKKKTGIFTNKEMKKRKLTTMFNNRLLIFASLTLIKENSCVLFKIPNIKSPWFLKEKIKHKKRRKNPENLVKKNKYKLASSLNLDLPPRRIMAIIGITEISKKMKKVPILSQEKIIKLMINKDEVIEINVEDLFL